MEKKTGCKHGKNIQNLKKTSQLTTKRVACTCTNVYKEG